MLAGNVSAMTGENIKPAYGGDEEAFLRKVVTPIYKTIAKVPSLFLHFIFRVLCPSCYLFLFYFSQQEAEKSKREKSKHSQWRNYDDLNEYFW